MKIQQKISLQLDPESMNAGIGFFQLSNLTICMIVIGAIALILGLIIACSNAATSWVIVAEGIGLIYTAITGFIGEKIISK